MRNRIIKSMQKFLRFAAAVLFMGSPLRAAESAPLLTPAELLENWKVSKQFTIAVAEKMPEEHYTFKASPEEMMFAVLMIHIAGSTVFRFEQLTGIKSGVDASISKTHPKPDVIRYLMDQHGLSRADMVPILGTASRVSEVLSGKKGLSMTMVQRLRARFGVPADVLLPPVTGRRTGKRKAA